MSWSLFRTVASRVWVAAVMFCAGWPISADPQNVEAKKPPVAVESPATNEFTISADVNLVLLDVSVRDSEGGYVSGLTQDNFTITEDGRPQKITQFANQDIPVTIGLIIDNSGSMRPKKPEVVTAALVLIQASNPQDEVFVVNFNDRVRMGLPDTMPFTDDTGELRKALAKTDPAGRTALYDSILAGLTQLEQGRRDKKTLVVVSDGGDNISTHTMHEAIDRVLASRATIYTIGIYDSDDREKNPDVLKKFAHVSGGVCYLPKKLSEVQDICRQIAKDIRTRYTIGYVPRNVAKPGVRHIKVEAHAPDHGKLIARTRTSYLVDSVTGSTDRQKK